MITFTVYADYLAAQAAGQRNIRFISQKTPSAPRNGVTNDNGGNAATQAAIHGWSA